MPGAAIERLTAALETRQLLLILDNCEHVIPEAARVAEALIRQCPRLSILASSRERLAIAGRKRHPGAAVAGAGDERRIDRRERGSIRRGAAFRRAGERARPRILPQRRQRCRGRVDLPPARRNSAGDRAGGAAAEGVVGATARRRLDERFRLLTGGSRTALPRQQTLHALIDWSYGLLSEPEKLLLARMAVFLGRTTLACISAVASPARTCSTSRLRDLMLSLVEKSLVQADLGGTETRYRLLEVDQILCDREARRYRGDARGDMLNILLPGLTEATIAWETTPTQQWIARYDADIDNLRGALEWAFGPDGDAALGLDSSVTATCSGPSSGCCSSIGTGSSGARQIRQADAGRRDGATALLAGRRSAGSSTIPPTMTRPCALPSCSASWATAFMRDACCAAGTARLLPDSIDEGAQLLRQGSCAGAPSRQHQNLGALPERTRFGPPVRRRSARGTLASRPGDRCLPRARRTNLSVRLSAWNPVALNRN